MGIKRLGRKNLFRAEKLGKEVEVGIGAGMKPALVSATQHREGQKLTTDIVLDLGTSKDVVLGHADGQLPVAISGSATLPAHICKLTADVFGYVTEIQTVCLELPDAGGMADYDLWKATDDAGEHGLTAAGLAQVGSNELDGCMAAVGTDKSLLIDDNGMVDHYLYLVNGAAASYSDATATIINIDATNDNIVNGSKLVLEDSDGVLHTLVIDKTVAAGQGGTGAGHVIGLLNLDSGTGDGDHKQEIGDEIKNAINAIAGGAFGTATHTPLGTVNIPAKTNSGASGNSTLNAFEKRSGDTSTMAIGTQFTGGTTTGKTSADKNAQFSSGKLLIRVTGFEAFDDL